MQKSLGFNDQLKESGEIGLINDSIDFCLSPDGVLGLKAEQEALRYLHRQRQRRLEGEFEGEHKDFKEVFQLRPLAAGNRCPQFNFLTPHLKNGITKVKHKKLSQSEMEHERVLNEQEVRLRSIADSEHRKHERQVSSNSYS